MRYLISSVHQPLLIRESLRVQVKAGNIISRLLILRTLDLQVCLDDFEEILVVAIRAVDVYLREARPDTHRQIPLPYIRRRVHGAEYAEVGMGLDSLDLSRLRQEY